MPKQVDHAERRQRIAEALWRVIIHRGLDAVSLRRVADEAGVSMGMVQHYFADKDEMLLFALRAMTTQVGDRMGPALAAAPDHPRARVRAMLAQTLPLDEVRRTEALVGCAFLVRAALDAPTAEHLREGWDRGRAYLADLLAAAGVPDPATRATLLLSVVDGLTLHTLAGHQTPDGALAALDAELDRVFTVHSGPPMSDNTRKG